MENGGRNNISKQDWKNKLADLDKQCGWDTTANLNWEDESDHYEDENSIQSSQGEAHLDHRLETPLRGVVYLDYNSDNESAIIDEDDEEYYQSTVYNQDGTQPPEEITTQRPRDLDFELRPGLMAYLEHRFWPTFRYEDRCMCHERLVDHREQRNQAERMYYAHYGSCLPQDACVLREYPQSDMIGTEEVDKPMLTVTTPDGETLYPHDEREWPQSLPESTPRPIHED